MTTPCPVCEAPYGFHDDEAHAETYARVRLFAPVTPAHTETRREQQAERHRKNQEWLAKQGD